ncbi:Hypothetical protein DEACI_1365 [Acididesulfobacillus acetoxydans]|uniref:Uncharacterized protein n=1 Tax=Acididesulfobacillus acetoxydans TaxID=1561005 RepID=A0A8S0WF65_9FIRM|nr:Hypothetical protein DEACI_1365 [Acididesulfobacillus acetoxydans]CEJ06179.1 Hypothetical protein DEACI_0625 [Acididesulfobacillus acetoxydans]
MFGTVSDGVAIEGYFGRCFSRLKFRAGLRSDGAADGGGYSGWGRVLRCLGRIRLRSGKEPPRGSRRLFRKAAGR